MDRTLRQHAVGMIARLLRDQTGQVINEDRRWRIDRAIEAVLRRRGMTCTSDILALLTQPDSATVEQELVEAMLNNETYFFRDRQIFAQIARDVLPSLCRQQAESRKLRIWSAGCSTGQETLSMAILLIEQGITPANDWSVDLVGSDVSRAAIETAKAGLYSRFEIQRGLSVGQMLRHFTETEQGWRANPSLLAKVRYEAGNLLDGAPAGGPFDLILCRNLMMYFDHEARQLACRRLLASLAPHGRLLLGGGEATLERSSGFVPASHDTGLYRTAAGKLAA